MNIRLLLLLNFLFISLNSYAEISRPGLESQTVTKVYTTVFVTDIDDVDSANQSFVANVYVEFHWHDPRLATADNTPLIVAFDKAWHPRIQIINQQHIFKTFPESFEVSKNGDVTYRQRYWGNFSQPLDLKEFPMDSQKLEIQLVAVGYNEKEVLFVQNLNEPSGLADKLSVTEWTVSHWTAEAMSYMPTKHVEPLSGFHLVIFADREVMYYTIKIIVPLLLIVAMSWLVFWIDPKESGSQISVAITTMLTLIAYRFAIGELVPKVSYLNRLDYFILGSTLMVFLTLLLVIITSNLAKSGQAQLANSIDRWSRVIFPLMLTVVTLISFV
ncbi:MAG: hypothetical protein GQ529_03495 [Methyloprofundus sp.]|nr:hypothetical protein [Methyloprofundus sp.]